MKLALAALLLFAVPTVADARRINCAAPATYPTDLPWMGCPLKTEKTANGQQVTIVLTYARVMPTELAQSFANMAIKAKWKATLSGTTVTAKRGHDLLVGTTAPSGNNATLTLVYTPG